MVGCVSIRESIRWVPEPPGETTSTIVLTSPEGRFVDLRIIIGGGEDDSEDTDLLQLPEEQLDWAIAGTSSSETVLVDGETIRRCHFEHWIDSRTDTPEAVVDKADAFRLPDETTLERGRMVNPATGLEADYEEVWRDKESAEDEEREGEQACVVLRHEDGGRRGMVVRLGDHAQGFIKGGGEMALARWKIVTVGERVDGESGDRRCCVMGLGMGRATDWPPMGEALKRQLAVGEQIQSVGGDLMWTVVEVA